MTLSCPERDALARLADGEATENDAASLRGHIAACTRCAAAFAAEQRLREDVAAPVAGIPTARLVLGVMEQLVEPRSTPVPWRLPLLAGGMMLTAAATVLLVLLPDGGAPRSERDGGSFQARGGAGDAFARRTGVTLHDAGPPSRELKPRDEVDADTRYVASYRNLAEAAPAYLLAFAIDRAGTVHWLYPAYLSADVDPPSLALRPGSGAVLPDGVVLDRPAPGQLRLVTILSPRPHRVSDIEGRAAPELSPAALAARFSGSVVRETVVEVANHKD
jgi:hypothetical protein